MIGVNEFGDPLFKLLTKAVTHYEGDEFDTNMTTLFNQFNFVIALEIRAVRMLRSFLAVTEKGPQYKTDITTILKNISTQREECDPLPMFEWYLNFKLYGGYYEMKALKPDQFIYMEWGNHRVSGFETDPGQKGHFHIKPYEDDAGYLVSCRYYPGECMHLTTDDIDDAVKSTTDLHDPQCHWLFHIKDMNEKIFKLSTVKWPGRYIYMKDDKHSKLATANADVKDHGDQAHFKLITFPWI